MDLTKIVEWALPLLLAHGPDLILGLLTLLATWLGAKYVAVRRAAKKFFDWVKKVQAAKANGVLTQEELAEIGQGAIDFSDEIWGIAKGLFPNRSKT